MQTTLKNAAEWAKVEFGGAQLGDKRRSERLVEVGTALARESYGTLPGSFQGNWAETKAAYRLLEEPDVQYQDIIAPHLGRVRADCTWRGEYLMVEDTTELDFTSHVAALDLGRIGDDGGRGLFVHSTLALQVQGWNRQQEPAVTVVGLMGQRWWARTMPTIGQGREKKRRRLGRDRESQRWAAVVEEVGQRPAAVRWTLVTDREGDIYETMARCDAGRWDFVIRANQRRALADQDGSVFDAVAGSRVLGSFSLELRARPGQPARRALVAVRACTVTLRGPWRPDGALPPRTVNVVEAREIHPPAGVEPVHWVLLTRWPVKTFKQALRVVKAYTCRWLVEEYHKSLKTGTGIEQSQLATAQRLTSLLGIVAVVAVRHLSLKLLATTCPDEPVDPAEFGPEGLAVLTKQYGRPVGGWTYRTVLRAAARLGGFLGRTGDGEPGWVTIWRGMRKLMWLIQGYDLARGEKCG